MFPVRRFYHPAPTRHEEKLAKFPGPAIGVTPATLIVVHPPTIDARCLAKSRLRATFRPNMAMPTHLEPVQPDPRKLRRTAWILVAIMVIGGTLILKAYEHWVEEKSSDTRPAFVGRLSKERDLPVLRHDGKITGLHDLAGKVCVIHAFSISEPESSANVRAVLSRLSLHYADDPDFAIVSLAIDPGPPESVAATLATAAESMNAELPQWWVASTEPEIVHKFVKKEFKASLLPHRENDQWVYDTSIVLIDKNRHIRRAVVPQERGGPSYVAPFDIDQAVTWDAQGKKVSPHEPEKTNAGELESLLIRTIDTLLKEPLEKAK